MFSLDPANGSDATSPVHRMIRNHALPLLAALLGVLASSARADEGMWTFSHPPVHALKSKYGFTASPEWLDALRAASVRVGGASGSFVSSNGLVLTNHHVALSCVQQLSSAYRDLVRNGFLARTQDQERQCPGLEVRRLESFEDVTEKMRSAIKSTGEAAANAERNVAIAAIETECKASSGLRCEVVTLYHGATYELYRYRVWTDVRLVFAPELRVAFFGGDADNFVYPRLNLDFSLLRVYGGGKPVVPAHYLHWGRRGVSEGDLVFAAGHPFSTNRLHTLPQLDFDRDVRYPLMIASAQRQGRMLQEFSAGSEEAKRRAAANLFGTENWLKAMLGEAKALKDPTVLEKKTAAEAALRESFRGAPDETDPWMRIEAATRKHAGAMKELWTVGYGFRNLFAMAGSIVELANERALAEGDRLAEYRDSAVPRLLLWLEADAPIYKDLETVRLADRWQEAIDLLGREHPFVKRVLGEQPPLAAATAAIEGTRLDSVAERRMLIEGGLAAVNQSNDPLIVLARDVYPMRRGLAKFREIEVDTPIRQASNVLAQARFKLLGADAYPDATGTLRLTYGTVRGYDADGVLVPWRTNFWGLFGRSDAFGSVSPFELPTRWIDHRRELAHDTPFNFVATLDIIGGNSGSPVVNRDGELVGLLFDNNLEGLGGRFVYTDIKARAIAVDARAIVEALVKVYGAATLASEMTNRDQNRLARRPTAKNPGNALR